MAKMAEFNYQRSVRILCDARRAHCLGKNYRPVCQGSGLDTNWQAFSPTNVFTGAGVLLLVSVLFV
jgi:hypothetical protein